MKLRTRLAISLGVLVLAGPIACAPAQDRASGLPVPLAQLPKAGANPSLAANTVITRFAVGSCDRQDASQAFWPAIAARQPQVFLMIGDNVYGDPGWDGAPDLGSFRAAYAKLAASPEFAVFRSKVPMLEVWDDHDFGPNDGGGTFAYKLFSEQIFETFWDAPRDARSHAGVYHSSIHGPAGRRVQFIMLDTRFFRSDLTKVPEAERAGRLGSSAPDSNPAEQMLGQEQWQWLQRELAKPADLRIVASSVQVLTEAHHFESWANFPLQRQRLLDLLAARAPSGLLLLSGDRHSAAIYALESGGARFDELTASSLNAPSSADVTAREPDPLRQTAMFGQANFGMVDIDWGQRKLALEVTGVDGAPLARRQVAF